MDLATKKAELSKMESRFNIMKLETRILEMDEEKIKILESIEKIKETLKEA